VTCYQPKIINLVYGHFHEKNLHTYELSRTTFHRVQGEEVGLPSVFEKFKKIKKITKALFQSE